MKHLVAQLATIFADPKVTNRDILQDGNKVAVRSELTANQRADFRGIPTKGRTLKIATSRLARVSLGHQLH
jgi:predicted ester cyclase